MNPKPVKYYLNRSKGEYGWMESRLSHYVSKMIRCNWNIFLDFRCCSGEVTKNMLLSHCRNLTKIIAVDVQPAFVDFAKETFGHERIEYIGLDITEKMNTKPAQYCSNRPGNVLECIDSRLSHYVSKMTGSNWDVVLDFGCGPGDVTKNILLSHCPNVTKIIAVDVQSALVDFAKETFGHERIEYMVLDITEKTPSQWSKMFDKVFAFLSFHYVRDVRKFLNILHDILKPGGYFLSIGIASAPAFSVWLEMSLKEEWKQYFIGIEKYIPVTHVLKDYCNGFKKLAKECGFVPIAVTSSLESVIFDSEKQFIDFHESVLPEEIVKQIPLENFDKFLDDYRKAFQKYEVTYNTDGTFAVQHTVLEICLQFENTTS